MIVGDERVGWWPWPAALHRSTEPLLPDAAAFGFTATL